MSRRLVLVAGVLTALAATAHAVQNLTRDDATRMEQKLGAIMARGALPPKAAQTAKPLRTSFTEREVNSYFKFNAETFPPGVVNPMLTIAEGGKLVGIATVDLEAIRKSKPRSVLDPMNLFALAGSVDLRVMGILKARAGMGTLAIESATLGGIPIPLVVLQEVIAHYTKTPDNPAGFSLDKPFPLPVGIREVEIQRGAATVVQ